MNEITLGYRVPDVPGICWTCDRGEGDLSQVLIFPHEIQKMLSTEEGRFDSPHFDPLRRLISSRSVPVGEFFANGICVRCRDGWLDRVDCEFVRIIEALEDIDLGHEVEPYIVRVRVHAHDPDLCLLAVGNVLTVDKMVLAANEKEAAGLVEGIGVASAEVEFAKPL